MASCPNCGATLREDLECAFCGPLPAGRALPSQNQRWIATVAYFWITGLVFLFVERFRQSDYVRFHSLQAVFFGLVVFVLNTTLAQATRLMDPFGATILLYATVWGLIRLGLVLIWILAMVKAYQGLPYKLPWIGGLAQKYSA